jgi:hypothetical protein
MDRTLLKVCSDGGEEVSGERCLSQAYNGGEALRLCQKESLQAKELRRKQQA